MQIVVIVIIAAVVLAFLAMNPGRGRPEEMRAFMRRPVAHRGLHDNKGEAPENSMAAYRLAVQRGYGIELDVRETKDGQLVTVHDRNLKRVAGCDRCVEDLTLDEIKALKLFGSEERIPHFADVLAMVGGRVPIVMEIKGDTLDMALQTSEKAARLLDSYAGKSSVCMESFHPAAVWWYRKHRPEMLRGQLSERFQGFGPRMSAALVPVSFLMTNFLTRPDFIAYNLRHRGLLRFRIQRHLFHAVCAAWTVRSQKQMDEAADDFDIFIFEGFEPREDGHA